MRKDAEWSERKIMYLEGFQIILNVIPQNHSFRPFKITKKMLMKCRKK